MSRMRLTMACAWLSRYRLSPMSFSSSISGGPSGRPRSNPLRSPPGRSPPGRSPPGRSPPGRSPRGPDPWGAPCAPRPSRGGRVFFRCSPCSFAPFLNLFTHLAPFRAPLRAATFPRRTVFLPLLLLLLCHLLNLCHQSGPFQGHQARGPQLHFRRFPAHHLADQMGTQLLEFTVPRAPQNPVEAPLETPGALDLRPAAVTIAPVETAQLIQELPGHPEIVNQPGHRILEIGGIVEVAPLQNAA